MKFSDIPAHEATKTQLRNLVADGRIPHAILLHGPAGIGKFALARAFAQYLHCENPTPGGDSCGECTACRQHESFNHVDTIHVFPVVKTEKLKAPVSDDYMTEFREFVSSDMFMSFEKWTTMFEKKNAQPVIYVSESEQLERRLSVTTTVARYKIVLIWLPEKMNEQTANKLLKLIEEPFADTIFILVSDDASSILPTIRSRCRPMEMRRLSDSVIANYLVENKGVDPVEAMALAHIADGSMSAAVAQLDATRMSRMFFDLFVGLMRKAYSRDVKELKAWASDIAALGREQEIKFYDYCQRLVRENFIFNFNVPDLNYLNSAERQFSTRFARFITERNAETLIRVMNEAAADIAGNANGKLVNFDLAVKVIMLIKQ